MAWGSKLPLVIAALTDRWTPAFAQQPTAVIKGPRVGNSSLKESLTVGYQDEENGVHAGNVIRVFEGLVANSQREQVSVNCAISVLNGTDIDAAMLRAYEILSAAAAVLAADVSLGKLVLSARIGNEDLVLTPGRNGQRAHITFTVDCDAFTGR